MKMIYTFILVAMLALPTSIRADVVRLNLLSVGCPTEFGTSGHPSSWTCDIDFGVEFSRIDNVYIDWAGSLTGSRVRMNGIVSPIDSGLLAAFSGGPVFRHVEAHAGGSTYPSPEEFSDIVSFTRTDYVLPQWADLLDGKGRITIELDYMIILNGTYVSWGTGSLSKAELVVDGIPVPEPSTLLVVMGGVVIARLQSHRRRFTA